MGGKRQCKVKAIVTTIGAGVGISKVISLSDALVGSEARLELIVDDGGNVEALQQKIFASAQASRGAYLETMQTVSKLGLMAGKAFSGNDEIIKFTELMNKNFIIAGASVQEQTSAMKDKLDIAEVDLKYMRDLAEQEAINRYTTAEIKVEMTNHNTVSSGMDIDGMVESFTEGVKGASNAMTERVHK